HFDIGSFPGFPVLAQPLQATALYCGMKWLPPFAMHCTFICDDETLQAQARRYRQRLIDWQEAHQNG
ncbi:glutathione-regulated potassium-efflux system ancillary protein KefF, partial [Pseudomonas aeruginosa]|nr:glutathione-regulated potassium-efflux system ancillary protein KefF [Pseudomonas aeruginosa]